MFLSTIFGMKSMSARSKQWPAADDQKPQHVWKNLASQGRGTRFLKLKTTGQVSRLDWLQVSSSLDSRFANETWDVSDAWSASLQRHTSFWSVDDLITDRKYKCTYDSNANDEGVPYISLVLFIKLKHKNYISKIPNLGCWQERCTSSLTLKRLTFLSPFCDKVTSSNLKPFFFESGASFESCVSRVKVRVPRSWNKNRNQLCF